MRVTRNEHQEIIYVYITAQELNSIVTALLGKKGERLGPTVEVVLTFPSHDVPLSDPLFKKPTTARGEWRQEEAE